MPPAGYLSALAMIGMALAPVPGMTKVKEVSLKGSSNWLVDWADHSCVLARKFGTADAPLWLSMRTYTPSYHFEMTIAGKAMSQLQPPKSFSIAYGTGSPIEIRRYQVGRIAEYGPALIFSGEMAVKDGDDSDEESREVRAYPDVPFEAQLDRIALTTTYRKLVLNTGPMKKALDSLRQCTDNLVKGWGLDPAVQASLSSRAKTENIRTWAQKIQASYPSDLLAQNKEARVNVLVIVDEQGMPKNCDTWQAFDNTDFKVRACGIILRDARFTPARDKDGRATASYYTTVIVYKS